MQPIFSRNDYVDKIAFLNWRIDEEDQILNSLNIANGFLTSAIQLAKQALRDNGHKEADITIFPILTNANHGIELYLKGIIWILNSIIKVDSKIEGSHNILQLYQTARAKVMDYNGDFTTESFDRDNANLKNYIDELFSKITAGKADNMDFSRYPMNGKGQPHFYVYETGNVEVDLENFVSRFKQIHSNLEDMSDYLYHQVLHGDR